MTGQEDDPSAGERDRMVREQIEARGVAAPAVLAAVRSVPRHLFVSTGSRPDAHEDRPLPIGFGQTISQPFMVAYMVERLAAAGARVLEIGTGSGYETAVLSRVAAEVFTVEIEPELARRAGDLLDRLGAANVRRRTGDGLLGWPEEAPFGRIVLTAAVPSVPKALLEQLAPGGWFLGPVGPLRRQELVLIRRGEQGFEETVLMPVFFVESRQP